MTPQLQNKIEELIEKVIDDELRPEVINDGLWYVSPDNVRFTLSNIAEQIAEEARKERDRELWKKLEGMKKNVKSEHEVGSEFATPRIIREISKLKQ